MWIFLFLYFIIENIECYVFVFFKDFYICEFLKENCIMEQLNSKIIKWVYCKVKYGFGKY